MAVAHRCWALEAGDITITIIVTNSNSNGKHNSNSEQ